MIDSGESSKCEFEDIQEINDNAAIDDLHQHIPFASGSLLIAAVCSACVFSSLLLFSNLPKPAVLGQRCSEDQKKKSYGGRSLASQTEAYQAYMLVCLRLSVRGKWVL